MSVKFQIHIKISLILLIFFIGSQSHVKSHTLFAPVDKKLTLGDEFIDRLKIRSIRDTNNTQQDQQGQTSNLLQVSYDTHWYTQDVDHFSYSNQDTYQQRYLVNDTYWCGKNCPILFYCGNEGDIEVFTNNTGWMWENAQSLHAMLVFAEHRYYGKSIPYGIDPTTTGKQQVPKLGYLSSEQALADYAKLIFEIKNNLYDAKFSPIIAIGGSYGGMLAAWFRMKYPHAVTGALAGSAPIIQFPEEYDCIQFGKIVTKDYENYSPNCSISIAKSWQVIRDFVGIGLDSHYKKPKRSNLDILGSIFNTCSPMDEDDVKNLIALLNSIWINIAMTDYANEADFLSKMPAYPMKHVCEYLSKDPIDLEPNVLIHNIALASQVYTNYTRTTPCLNITSLVYDPMDVMWDFQSCTEMVMPICFDGVNDMFEPTPFNVSQFISSCNSRWGVTTRPNQVRTLYGDKSLTGYSNIIFSTCSRDPWSAGCPQESNPARSIHAIKVQGACHHEDLRASGPNDGPELKKARQDELNIISDWIREHYDQTRNNFTNETFVWNSISD